jgi:hypothetical protein
MLIGVAIASIWRDSMRKNMIERELCKERAIKLRNIKLDLSRFLSNDHEQCLQVETQ